MNKSFTALKNTFIFLTTFASSHTLTQIPSMHEIIAYYQYGKHDQELNDIITTVRDTFSTPAQHDKQLVIFDIDEVALSFYPFFQEATQNGASWDDIRRDPTTFMKYMNFLKTIQLPAQKPLLDLYHHFITHNYKIVFLTHRTYDIYEETHSNLHAVGYTCFERLITRPPEGTDLPGCLFKEQTRQQLAAEGYEIVCCIDDFDDNLQGTHVGYPVKIPSYFHE